MSFSAIGWMVWIVSAFISALMTLNTGKPGDDGYYPMLIFAFIPIVNTFLSLYCVIFILWERYIAK